MIVLIIHAFLLGLWHNDFSELVVNVKSSHCLHAFVSFVGEVAQKIAIFEEVSIDALFHQYLVVGDDPVCLHCLLLVSLLQYFYVFY